MPATDGSIAVNLAALRAGEAEIGARLAQLRARLDRLETELQPLVTSWTGDAQQAYLIQKKQWETAATDLSTLLAALVTALGQTGIDYGDAQRKIVAQFS